MGTTWRENYSFPRIFKGRQEDTGHSKSTVLFQSEYPISGQTDSRVIRLLKRKDNSSRVYKGQGRIHGDLMNHHYKEFLVQEK